MSYGHIKDAIKIQQTRGLEHSITIGEVVDTNDPQQMGRLRVFCPSFGDSASLLISNIPWAMYAAPFAGATEVGSRGRGDDKTSGPVAYGMWNIPKVGSYVLVGCVDGDPSLRFWFAALHPQFMTHTMPHGRYFKDTNEGPLSSTEQPINPLHDNQTEAFTNTETGVQARQSHEWKSRGADKQVAQLHPELVDIPLISEISKKSDDRTTGYGESRIEPEISVPSTDGVNWDPQTYSWVTPGFHSITMDDRQDNCRVRFRTTGGTQIILDDTNERIYISTAKGKTWVEIDEQGTIDIFSAQDFSVRSKGDINFTTDKSFRVKAKQGIHLDGKEIRVNSAEDVNVKVTQGSLRVNVSNDVKIEAGGNIELLSGEDTLISSSGAAEILAGSDIMITTNGVLHLLASGNILAQGSQIHLNGPAPTSATSATNAEPKAAYTPSKIPDHEPYPRSYLKVSTADNDDVALPFGNFIQQHEYPYTSAKIGTGSAQRGIVLQRNPEWKR